jgi:hypothetical protein
VPRLSVPVLARRQGDLGRFARQDRDENTMRVMLIG